MSSNRGTPPAPCERGAVLSVEERKRRAGMTFARLRWVNMPHAADCRCKDCAAALAERPATREEAAAAIEAARAAIGARVANGHTCTRALHPFEDGPASLPKASNGAA